jgi:hypothetical protein
MRVESQPLVDEAWKALGGPESLLERLTVTGEGDLPSAFPVTDLAVASIAAAVLSVAELLGRHFPAVPDVTVDRRLTSFWFGSSIRPIGWTMPAAWDPIAGDYRTQDGWIRLHTNAPHHRVAAEHILGRHVDKAAMAKAVGEWSATELETAIVAAGGCAAEMRSLRDWAEHPQGRAVASEPIVMREAFPCAAFPTWAPQRHRPLAGLKVLDLTRVLAGPVASRFLAGYGAEVLRIDPPGWNEPGVVPEVTLGKRCARLDLEDASDRRIFEELLSRADILLHGYRPGALDRLGYDEASRRSLAPCLIDVSLSAYGWSGPWGRRRGFDSLVQMSAGIAQAGMEWKGADRPTPLPVQALDHATGYLMAAAAVRAIAHRITTGEGTTACLSLARAAQWLADHRGGPLLEGLAPETTEDLSPDIEHSAWGEARRVKAPAAIVGAAMHWRLPASELGSAAPTWS